ncbi:replicative DNA helicase, partial [Escherichia coli]|uniref:DnaB-like helicase N-terminal domain-containing protein n=1 Tax=Escherichia coli TaxID=562 RepID=UPI0021555473
MNDYAAMPSEDREISQLSLPPLSMEAEQSVLGGLLLENPAWDRIADVVLGEDFYRHEHRLIFRSVAKLINESRPADVITVQEDLQRNEELEAAGGFEYLISLAQNTPSAANNRRSAEIDHERPHTRPPPAGGTETARSAYNPHCRHPVQPS